MPRGTGKRPPVRRPEAEPEPEGTGPEPEGAGPEPVGTAAPSRVRPAVAQDERQRYEAPPDEDVFAISQRDYTQLASFLDGLSDRDRYGLGLWRCDPRIPTNRKKQKYLPGGMDIPEGMLEDALSDLHGPGVYRWQLLKDGRYASPDKMPPSLKGVAVAGYIQIAGEPLPDAGGLDGPAFVPAPPDGSLELVREMLAQSREDAKSGRGEMAEILRATTEGFKVQMGGMVESMKAQNGFLQAQLEHQRQESRERTAEKDGMWKMLVEIQRDMREGDSRSTADRLLDSAPALIEKLQGAGLFAARPGPAAVPPAPSAAEAAAAAARPMAGPTEEERKNPMFMYVTTLVNRLHSCYQAGMDADLTAQALERLGSEEQFEWLMNQPESTVIETVDALCKRFLGHPAEPRLVEYVRAVWKELTTEEAPEPAPAAPAVPAAAPAVPAPEAPKPEVQP